MFYFLSECSLSYSLTLWQCFLCSKRALKQWGNSLEGGFSPVNSCPWSYGTSSVGGFGDFLMFESSSCPKFRAFVLQQLCVLLQRYSMTGEDRRVHLRCSQSNGGDHHHNQSCSHSSLPFAVMSRFASPSLWTTDLRSENILLF